MLCRLVSADNFRPVIHHFLYIRAALAYCRTFTHHEFYSQGLARLGQGKAIKSRTDNECVLDSVLIGPEFICHVFPYKSIAL